MAFKPEENILRVVECKSYLDSTGVTMSAFDGSNQTLADRFKLFNDANLRNVVFSRLRHQLVEMGACRPDVDIHLCRACGRIANETHRAKLKVHFLEHGWELRDDAWLIDSLKRMAQTGYENQVSAIVAKLLLRGRPRAAV